MTLPSADPSGFPSNDTIYLTYHPAAVLPNASRTTPAVVLIHSLGERDDSTMTRLALFFADRGIAAAVITLPYHMQRATTGRGPISQFTGTDPDRSRRAMLQSASDVSTVAAWLRTRPDIDPKRVGIVGVSLGAVIVHLAMGRDDSLTAGVAILGSGNMAGLRKKSFVFKRQRHDPNENGADGALARLADADPLTYADKNRPRNVLMIQAARDLIMPSQYVDELWEALGKPPIRWTETNHYGLFLGLTSLARASEEYLRFVWSGAPRSEMPPVPRIGAPAIKIGILTGLDPIPRPAIQWQVVSFLPQRRRDHLSPLQGNIGFTGRSFFGSVGATVNPYLDLGFARRFDEKKFRPYASLHIVF